MKKALAVLKWVGIGFAGIIILGIVISIISGGGKKETQKRPSSDVAAAPTVQAPRPSSLVTIPASSLVLTVSDMPLGWIAQSSGEETRGDLQGYYASTLAKPYGVNSVEVLITNARVFPTVDEATQEYVRLLKLKQEKYSTKNLTIGDESFIYQEGNNSIVVIRRKNVILAVRMVSDLFGGSANKAEDWAKAVVKKVP